MSQTFTDDSYDGSNNAQTDLGNMEDNFSALKSMFSGASAPSSPDPFQPWGDTAQLVLKYRNAGDSVWVGLFHGDSNQKIWLYRNSALDGWAVDSSATDRILVIKGGATYTTGGAMAGTWTIPSGLDHVHQWYKSGQPSGDDKVGDEDGNEVNVPYVTSVSAYDILWVNDVAEYPLDDSYTDEQTLATATYRPAAGVGSMQYLDL